MQCPKCKSSRLAPTKIDKGLSAMGCQQCSGALVSLLYYRDWAENAGSLNEKPDVALLKGFDSQDTVAAISCPKCKKLMTKFRISGCSTNRLDLCPSCDEAWLDDGEWELLKALELSTEIPMVMSEKWQKHVRDTVSEESRRERFSRILGKDDLEKAHEIRQWLKKHPKRADLMFYINYQ